jgi:2-aminoethylphosphonate-pyruvate transaminase
LEAEGGVPSRNRRYCENQRSLVAGMERLGFQCLLPHAQHSPIITGFHSPVHEGYQFGRFYQRLKDLGFVIYPGKVTGVDSFRIGTIGHVFPTDIDRLIQAVETAVDWNRSSP